MNLATVLIAFLGFYFLGRRIAEKLPLHFDDGGEAFIVASALGCFAVSYITALLCFLHLVYPAVFWLLLAAVFVFCFPKEPFRQPAYLPSIENLRRGLASLFSGSGFFRFNVAILVLLFFVSLSLAQLPPTRTDALVYHLALPKAYLENHGLVHLPNNIYSFFPHFVEMVYLFFLALGGEGAAVLSGWALSLLLLFALSYYFRQNFGKRLAYLPAILIFSTPTFLEVASSAYIDVPLGTFVFMAFYCWDRWRTTQKDPWLWLMVAFTGATVATKLTAVVVLPLAFLGVALQGRKRLDSSWIMPRLGILVLGVALCMLPWWARNLYFSGNPFAPFFIHIFGGEGGVNWDPGRTYLLQQLKFGFGSGLKEFLLLPIHLTFFSQKGFPYYDGYIGYLWLALLPCAYWALPRKSDSADYRNRILSLIFVFAVLFAFWFISFQRIRYLTLLFPFLALLLACGFQRMPAFLPFGGKIGGGFDWKRFVRRLAALALLANLVLILNFWAEFKPLPFLFKMETREAYLTRRIPEYRTYQAFNRTLKKNDKALFVFMRNFGYYCDRPFYSDSFFEGHTLRKILASSRTATEVAQQLRRLGITHLMYNANLLLDMNSNLPPEQQRVLAELLDQRTKRIFQDGHFYLLRLVFS